jgi:glycosyltransferase involved in cell wall biosynthesis
MKVLIVAPEVGGVPGVGGVGTFVYHLSHVLSCENEVSIICTDSKIQEDLVAEYGLSKISVVETPQSLHSAERSRQSYHIAEFLKFSDFDHVIFSDWAGAGYFLSLSRRSLQRSSPIVTVVAHGCTTWAYSGLKQFLSETDPIEHISKVSIERITMEMADYLVSPSRYMNDWVSTYVTSKTASSKTVLKQPFYLSENLGANASYTPESIAFFGRLEERKGLGMFVDSILQLHATTNFSPEILILGKPGWMKTGEFGDQYVKRRFSDDKNSIKFSISTNLSSEEAMQKIVEKKSLVVIPSQLDNAPYTIVESIVKKFQVVSVNTGGIPEYLPQENISQNNSDSLCKLMVKFLGEQQLNSNSIYSPVDANEAWKSFVRDPKNFCKE